MGDEVDGAVDVRRKLGDRRMNVSDQRFQRLGSTLVIEVKRGKAGRIERALHLAE